MKGTNGSLSVVALVLAWLAFPASAPAAPRGPVLLVGVLPSAAPSMIRAQWGPFLDRLSDETGQDLRLRTYREIADFDKDCDKGVPDLIFAHPVQMVGAHKGKGYIPLVRGGTGVSGVVFVRKDSPVKNVKDLEGGSIALVGSRNVCSLFVRQDLGVERGINFRRHFAGAAAKVVDSVLLQRATAGATLDSAFESEPAEKKDQLRIIHTTCQYPPHPLAAHPRVPAEVREAVTQAVLKMGAGPEGAGLLRGVRLPDPQRADFDRDYLALEKVNYGVLSQEE